jgi:glyceraldehyde-3-phosphate dehydrogenase (NADP+)
MTEKMIDALFPAINKIPKQLPLKVEGTIIQDQYLVKGELRRWNEPFHEVFLPVRIQDSSGLRPLIIGSYPLLTETESMEALHAARDAFDNGSGPWPSMTIEQRIICFEDFLSGMKGNREEI